jgi:hypothetical protein
MISTFTEKSIIGVAQGVYHLTHCEYEYYRSIDKRPNSYSDLCIYL